ncbi:DUF1835 domain-containing protein [Paenibacillus nanensis]|uniref:DUF1835 domain-containing protein n=1 Tax=Paenibacillus nanensis TaxID=393251 RepID=A0A3A1UMT8_9BACL|nr:DUF1835 domain-containing protein [Paenibacillus nanensis]RIX47085.1 DUF1835 domain-containing protein [Paenibacillus nanensis]
MDKLYESLHHFGEKELRMLYFHLLKTLDRYYEDGSIEDKHLAEGFVKIIQDHIDAVRDHQLQTYKNEQYVHLVFSLSDAGSLKVALGKIGKRNVCQVLAFNELFSVGPLSRLETTAGQQNRLLWMMEHDRDYILSHNSNREHQLEQMVNAVRSIPEHKTIVIWCANNAHDQTGLRFALYLLKEREQPVHIVNVTERFHAMGLSNKDGGFSYASGLIDQDHFQVIVNECYEGTPLDANQRSRYESEWFTLAGEDHVLRLWEDGKVRGNDESALDAVIVKSVIELEQEQDRDGFIKAGIVVGRVLDTSQQLVGYSFLTYRIWILVNQGILAFKGLPSALHQFSVKLLRTD